MEENLKDVTPGKSDEEKQPMFKKNKILAVKNDKPEEPEENEELDRSQERLEERIKKTLMWNLGRPED